MSFKKAKGQRPIYLQTPEVDQLMAIVLALAGEVSVLRERLDTLERLLEAKGTVSQQEIEAFHPDEQAAAVRDQWRADYLARILRIIQEEVEAPAASSSSSPAVQTKSPTHSATTVQK